MLLVLWNEEGEHIYYDKCMHKFEMYLHIELTCHELQIKTRAEATSNSQTGAGAGESSTCRKFSYDYDQC